nr:MAG TPA: hypothetical protein [Caudoviricetes sp.]
MSYLYLESSSCTSLTYTNFNFPSSLYSIPLYSEELLSDSLYPLNCKLILSN